MKLGTNSQDLQDFILARLRIMKSMSDNEGKTSGIPKLGVKL
jgi:hypothetical protein